MRPSRQSRSRSRAFTIIEMLTVMAIIGILAAILFPSLTGSSTSARKAKTKVQFSQWALAIEGFRQEYGYYPTFLTNLVNGNLSAVQKAHFQEILSGKGAINPATFISVSENGSNPQNKKRIGFLSFGHGDLIDGAVVDAFGNNEIAVLVDKDQNGIITVGAGGDYSATDAPLVNGMKPEFLTPPAGIRAGVIFYSPGPRREEEEMVKSWE